MEANNTKAMREALEELVANIEMRSSTFGLNVMVDTKTFLDAKAALAAPARNCDVGTPDEQAERFENFCLKHIGCAEETGGRHCVGCPLEKASRSITQKCELYWAQMPYEKGGAK